ncbi:methylated-DNA--[protein]-cysteine S-methyltransferase [Parvularcula oceani]|uniref:methylated-DNA--[protein]-cysteine S-methyltransferase n=1 Tax=Parvularcula oceani TaxID=1247963 RepID=UPI00068B4857|nr:methylated-DNA--[protein]-cysteine S-methyltransferase [Parvularcula oceani]
MTVTYLSLKTALGPAAIAATRRGVCLLTFLGEGETAEGAVRAALPDAMPAGAGDPLIGWAAAVERFLAEGGRRPDLPLDLRGTAFQEELWQALCEIPSGETVTYGELARRLGKPRAARAVGGACGANKVAVLVPCHLVLGGSGGLGGYAFGAERKKRLLALEGVAA